MTDGILQNFLVNAREIAGPFQDARQRKGAMALLGQFLEHEAQGGTGPQRRLPIDAHLLGQFVGRLKADAPDVAGQAIRVLLHLVEGLIAVGLPDADRPGRTDAVRVQKDHDVAHGLLLFPAGANQGDAVLADALDFLEKRRTFIDHFQGAVAEGLDDLVREKGTDALDESGSEELFDALGRIGRRRLHRLGEIAGLRSGSSYQVPVASRYSPATTRGIWPMTVIRSFCSLTWTAQHREPVFRVVKGDAFNDAGQGDAHRKDIVGGFPAVRGARDSSVIPSLAKEHNNKRSRRLNFSGVAIASLRMIELTTAKKSMLVMTAKLADWRPRIRLRDSSGTVNAALMEPITTLAANIRDFTSLNWITNTTRAS